jgi:peptide/nickel transport system ATP-binding protein/oligopeptide transport system ATP-binding protein
MTALSILRLIPDPPGRIVEGEIFFKGKDLLQLREKEMRAIRGREISMVFQEPNASMNPSFTNGSQIREVIRFHQGGRSQDVRDRAEDILRAVQIPDPQRVLNQYPHELSGGMLQRIMIAMAISCEPQVLICDEPTTALDVSTQAQIIKLLDDLRRERNTSLLFITHDLGVLSWVCTSAAVMYAGNIVEYSDIRRIVKSPRHPYTQALIGATPRLWENEAELSMIRGQVPSLAQAPSGCKFHPRCDLFKPDCKETFPLLEEKEPGHWVACHFT